MAARIHTELRQIHSSKETTANGSVVYDDCSLTSQ